MAGISLQLVLVLSKSLAWVYSYFDATDCEERLRQRPPKTCLAMDEDEAVDYAGSDGDDVISLGEEDPLQPLEEPQVTQATSAFLQASDQHLEHQAEPSSKAQSPEHMVPASQRHGSAASSRKSHQDVISRLPPSGPRSYREQQADFSSDALHANDPAKSVVQDSERSGPPLPVGWMSKTSKSTGQTYFYNADTDESSWSRPVVSGAGAPKPTKPPPTGPRVRAVNNQGDTWRPTPAEPSLANREDRTPRSRQDLARNGSYRSSRYEPAPEPEARLLPPSRTSSDGPLPFVFMRLARFALRTSMFISLCRLVVFRSVWSFSSRHLQTDWCYSRQTPSFRSNIT